MKVIDSIDVDFYRSRHPDLAHFDEAEARAHYETYGRHEGRAPCAGAAREEFLAFIPRHGPILEIGPFAQPALSGPTVKYADMLSTAQLRQRAPQHGLNPDTCPEIDYVLSEVPLGRIGDRFDSVFSSHCIEHQTDLIEHLRAVDDLLLPGGAYYVIVPDKRYCFDHFTPETTIADVVAAHAEKRTTHSLVSLVKHAALQAHNDSQRHWCGDHGEPAIRNGRGGVDDMIAAHAAAHGTYIDCHAWQFTPASFAEIHTQLVELGYVRLQLAVVYPTLAGRNEFCAIFRK